jgi:hypothetical protein
MKLMHKKKGDFISLGDIKKVLNHTIICGAYSQHGGNRKGIPKCYTYDIIKELVNMKLITKINKTIYKLEKYNYNKTLKKEFW